MMLWNAFFHFSTSKLQKVLPDPQFLTFWLPNVCFVTVACIFSTSELQKVLRSWRVLYIFTSKCAFRHSGVQFLISPLSTYLRTRRFNRPTFRLTRHTNHWKTQLFATSLTFGADVSSFFWLSRYCIFFLLTWLLYSAFQLSILSEVCYLNFLRLYSQNGNLPQIGVKKKYLKPPPILPRTRIDPLFWLGKDPCCHKGFTFKKP